MFYGDKKLVFCYLLKVTGEVGSIRDGKGWRDLVESGGEEKPGRGKKKGTEEVLVLRGVKEYVPSLL